MIAEKEISIIFNADVLAEPKFGAIMFRLFSNGTPYVHVSKYRIKCDLDENAIFGR